VEHGIDANPSFEDLLPYGSKIQKLTPSIGSEVTGVQLSGLTTAAKDQLALLVAQRKVVVFRDQDFADLPLPDALNWGGYFGHHHIHPTSGSPEEFPEFHIVHRLGTEGEADSFFAGRTSSVAWHSDVSYEAQPPGTTFLYVFDSPEVGGDTSFVNQVEAYNRLSPALKERLHGLKAVHSGFEQAEFSRGRGGVVRREPITSEHPLIRTHPATGEKALYVNSGCKCNAQLKKFKSLTLVCSLKLRGALLVSRRRKAMHCSSSCMTTSAVALISKFASVGPPRR
jgi:alpha-ketoglutarate-dependent taurine dioxygenase